MILYYLQTPMRIGAPAHMTPVTNVTVTTQPGPNGGLQQRSQTSSSSHAWLSQPPVNQLVPWTPMPPPMSPPGIPPATYWQASPQQVADDGQQPGPKYCRYHQTESDCRAGTLATRQARFQSTRVKPRWVPVCERCARNRAVQFDMFADLSMWDSDAA